MDNYLLGKGRRSPLALLVVTCGNFVLVCCWLWYAALDPQVNQAGAILHLTALGFTAAAVFGIPFMIDKHHFSNLRWRIEEKLVILENKKERYVFDLDQDFLVTRCTFQLSTGKSSTSVPMFWLMRPDQPCKLRDNGGYGPMKKILRSGGMVLPRQAMSSLLYATGLTHIPDYPRSVLCIGK